MLADAVDAQKCTLHVKFTPFLDTLSVSEFSDVCIKWHLRVASTACYLCINSQ